MVSQGSKRNYKASPKCVYFILDITLAFKMEKSTRYKQSQNLTLNVSKPFCFLIKHDEDYWSEFSSYLLSRGAGEGQSGLFNNESRVRV